MPFEYPRAGLRAPQGIREEIDYFRRLPSISPIVDKSQMPLLYYLLGSGTMPFKMSKKDAAYQGRPVGTQQCSNCSSAYQNLVSGDLICSQVEGIISRGAWCRIWNSDRR